jgi:hypothetical protein
MEQNDNYFNNKSDAEKLRNVSSMVNDIVNAKPKEPEVQVEEVPSDEPESTEPERNELVDAVGKAISTHKPRGLFMQGVQTDGNPKI